MNKQDLQLGLDRSEPQIMQIKAHFFFKCAAGNDVTLLWLSLNTCRFTSECVPIRTSCPCVFSAPASYSKSKISKILLSVWRHYYGWNQIVTRCYYYIILVMIFELFRGTLHSKQTCICSENHSMTFKKHSYWTGIYCRIHNERMPTCKETRNTTACTGPQWRMQICEWL